MRKINMGRVLLGGLLAGVIVNVGETILNVAVAGPAMEAALGVGVHRIGIGELVNW